MTPTGTSTRGDRSPGTPSPATPEEDVAQDGSRPASATKGRGSLLPFVGIASLFVLVTITLNVSATLRRTLERELGGRLRISAELAGDALASWSGEGTADDALLARLEEVRASTGVSEILLYDRGGVFRGGAYAATGPGTDPPPHLPLGELASGRIADPLHRLPERDVSGGIALLVPVAEASGGGALLTRIDPDNQGGLPAIDFLFQVAKALAGIVTAAGLLILLRWVTGGHHFVARPAERAPGSDVGLVLGTVKEVMSTLKDREAVHRDYWAASEVDEDTQHMRSERIVASIESGLVAFDIAGRVTLFNRGAERILGFAARSAVGRLVTELFDEDDPVRRIVDELLGDLRTRRRVEWERIRPDVGARWLAASSSVVRDRRGVPQGGLLLIDDLTERRKARDAAGLRDRLDAVGDMSAGIAAEIRRALDAIEDGTPDAEALASLETTVRGVLELSQPTRPVREPADLNAMLADVAGNVRERSAAAGVELVLELTDGLPRVRVETTSMRQAFEHCVGNALEAMEPQGSGTLTIASRVTELKTDDDGGSRPAVRVSFRDTGPGVPEADRHRIFTPFHTTKGGGRGLGLPLVHRAVTAHDGRVHLHSRPGVGSEFVVVLPVEVDG
jgi:PAS domain S-box-containing protein